MGWDAFAEPVVRLYEWKHGTTGIRDPAIEAAFVAAEKRVMDACGQCDGLLRQAGLDVSDCAEELARATGKGVYPEGPRPNGWDWSPDEVRHLATDASWKEPDDPERLWAFHSAREFLNTCAALGLGVRFSW